VHADREVWYTFTSGVGPRAKKREVPEEVAMADEPVVAQKGPCKVDLLATYRYAWCACGRSKYQPFCDGSHTMAQGLKPVIFTQATDQTAALCGCKHSKTPPFCDGTHRSL
jgi:CDGSH iron-sulfur domain-containing protein 3